MGLVPSFGPKSIMKPKPTSIKPRSAILFILSIFRQCLCRHYTFNGQGHHLRLNSPPSLLWINNHSLRILDFASAMAMIYDSKSLKSYGFLFPNSICWSFEGSHGRSVTMFQYLTILSKDFKHRPITISSKFRILLFQEDIECYKRDHEPLFCASKQALPDYKSVASRSLADALLRVALLASARTLALLSSSASPCLMTVTILSSIELFAEDLSTNRDLTCAKTLHSLSLKALMESLSIYFIYIVMALGNVHLCYVLNFEDLQILLSVLGII